MKTGVFTVHDKNIRPYKYVCFNNIQSTTVKHMECSKTVVSHSGYAKSIRTINSHLFRREKKIQMLITILHKLTQLSLFWSYYRLLGRVGTCDTTSRVM